MPNFGWSFMPGTSEPSGGPARTNGTPADPVQEAIRILSLRLPTQYGATAIAPAPLLTSMGGMGALGARPGATAQAIAMLAGGPLQSTPAPAQPVPVVGQDRGQVSTALPQPRPRDPDGTIRDEPRWEPPPEPRAAPSWPTLPSTPEPRTGSPPPTPSVTFDVPTPREDRSPSPPPVEAFNYDTFDRPSYQESQASADEPLSPYEFLLRQLGF